MTHPDLIAEIPQEDPEADWKAKGWTPVQCHGCGGHGLVSDYGFGGEDFYGAKECWVCDGNGRLWRSAKGRLALFPGGPFRGRT